MSYDADTRTFAIYSEDYNLLGFKSIEVSAYLKEYLGVTSGAPLITWIDIIDPCDNPFNLIATDQSDVPPYYYTFD